MSPRIVPHQDVPGRAGEERPPGCEAQPEGRDGGVLRGEAQAVRDRVRRPRHRLGREGQLRGANLRPNVRPRGDQASRPAEVTQSEPDMFGGVPGSSLAKRQSSITRLGTRADDSSTCNRCGGNAILRSNQTSLAQFAFRNIGASRPEPHNKSA